MARVVIIVVIAVALALVYLTSHPNIFDDPETGPALGVGELTNLPPNHRYSSDPSFHRRIIDLQEGETAVIQYRRVGGGVVNYEFLVTRHDDGSMHLHYSGHSPENAVPRILADAEVTGLDQLLEYYRSSREGFCSVQDLIRIRWTRDGVDLAHELFVDSTCCRWGT